MNVSAFTFLQVVQRCPLPGLVRPVYPLCAAHILSPIALHTVYNPVHRMTATKCPKIILQDVSKPNNIILYVKYKQKWLLQMQLNDVTSDMLYPVLC